ncbi:membrane-spanning 4-domains subfamily A member 4A [Astyanax mexicanus]|uniref:membrane-spanning 4-domains subfamily A member 4A n=1 Tax=Astyanax mexicanus TaxID=7994 RepID=UPI0020CB5C6D|nr:membrane-spanning 4-domains subfamily A member 4A [Astyanax mexicanus]
MSTTAVPDNNPRNGFVVVTHVIPPPGTGQNGAGPVPGVPTVGFPTAGISSIGVPNYMGMAVSPVVRVSTVMAAPNRLAKFLKGQPKAVGTMEIMIGIIAFLFAIVLTVSAPSVSIYSGVLYWGSVIYIITGSLTVAAENSLSSCLVNGSLGMNVFSAVVSGTAVIILSVDVSVGLGYELCYGSFSYYDCKSFKDQTAGITGVLLVLSVLQFMLSICISSFGCKATCCSGPSVPVARAPPTQETLSSIPTAFQAYNGQQNLIYINNPSVNQNNTSPENPPPYSTCIPKPED